jgi:hypothetical protein
MVLNLWVDEWFAEPTEDRNNSHDVFSQFLRDRLNTTEHPGEPARDTVSDDNSSFLHDQGEGGHGLDDNFFNDNPFNNNFFNDNFSNNDNFFTNDNLFNDNLFNDNLLNNDDLFNNHNLFNNHDFFNTPDFFNSNSFNNNELDDYSYVDQSVPPPMDDGESAPHHLSIPPPTNNLPVFQEH